MDQLANRSKTTKYHYKRYLGMFSDWMGKSPDELVEMQRRARESKGDPRENRVLEGKVRAFLNHMEKEGFAIGTLKFAYAGILSFFEFNLQPLDMHPNDRPSGEAEGSRIPDKEEIVKMLNAAKSQGYRTAILFLKDSGLRVSDAVRLKWKDAEDMGEGFWSFKILTRKRKVMATPFVGPETTEALEMLERKDERIFPVSRKALSNAISRICSRANLKEVSAHSLRKYFNVELQAARVPREWRYQMMGKKTGAYDENRIRKLFEAYRQNYDNLRVYGAGVNAEVEKLKQDVERLREENRELRQRLNSHVMTQDQIEALMERIKRLEEQAKG